MAIPEWVKDARIRDLEYKVINLERRIQELEASG